MAGTTVKDLLVRYKGDTKDLESSSRRASGEIDKVKKSSDTASKALSGLRGAAISLGGVYAVQNFAKSIIDTRIAIEGLQSKMIQAVGITGNVTAEIERLRNMSNELGLEFMSTGNQFASFAAAARASGLDMGSVRDVFYETAKAGTAMKLSSADMSLVFSALTQIAGKGVVSMEEMRQQLGERIPIAMAAMASGLNMTIPALTELISDGALPAKEGLEALARGFRENEDLAASFAAGASGLQANLNRLQNSVTELKSGIAENETVMGSMNRTMERLNQIVADPSFADGLAAIATTIGFIAESAALAVAGIGSLVTSMRGLINEANNMPNALKMPQNRATGALKDQFEEDSFFGQMGGGFGVSSSRSGGSTSSVGGTSKTTEDQLKAQKEAADAAQKSFDAYSRTLDEAKQKQQNLANDLADRLASMGGSFESLRDVAVSALQDILKNMLRLQMGGTADGGIGGMIGTGLSGFLGNIFGGSKGKMIYSSPAGPGFATGGSFQVGGQAGNDRNMLSLNGSPIANVSRGETIGVGRANGGSGVTVNQTINVSTGVQQTVRAEMMGMLPQIKQQSIAAVKDAQARGAL